jgi:Ca2+:H+ antiporter
MAQRERSRHAHRLPIRLESSDKFATLHACNGSMTMTGALLRREWFLGIAAATSLAFLLFGTTFEHAMASPAGTAIIFAWLFVAILGSVFAVVRHADALAERLGEPYGTLILTLAVTTIEAVAISAVMLHAPDDPEIVRDTIFAVVMIILNGMVGISLLLGGWRYLDQPYNLQGANAYLSVIVPVTALSLILPSFTKTTPGPTLSTPQEIFLVLMSVGLYGAFLAIQTGSYRGYFTLGDSDHGHHAAPGPAQPLWLHVVFLIAFMICVVFLAEHLAEPLAIAVDTMHAPPALGGIAIALLVAAPEAIGAIRAALANQVQRSVNIVLGSVLATISLTIPAMLVIAAVLGRRLELGLEGSSLVMLVTTLFVSAITFTSARTNVLQGLVHLILFVAYLMLVFQS